MSDLLHVLSNAERAHVGPYFLDVGEAFFPGTAFACIIPAAWIFSLNGPEGVLLFVVDDYLVDRVVFAFVPTHLFLPDSYQYQRQLLLVQPRIAAC